MHFDADIRDPHKQRISQFEELVELLRALKWFFREAQILKHNAH